jgi:hypothetical protein
MVVTAQSGQNRKARKMNTENKSYELPQRFFDDHKWRDLINDSFNVVAVKRNTYVVTLSQADAEELMSDALYYALCMSGEYVDFGLIASARATVGRLVKQGLHDYFTRDWQEQELINKFCTKYNLEVKVAN